MKTIKMTVGEFKSRFSEALASVARGESVSVTYGRNKRPIAVFAPPPVPPRRKLGLLAGKATAKFAPDWKMTEEEFLGL